MAKKILILTGSYGSGHNAAAQALKNTAEKNGSDVVILDIVDFLKDFFIGKSSKNFYEEFCEQYPKIWEATYNIIDNTAIKRLLFGIRYPIFQERFDSYIEKESPDEIISVFPFWGGFIKKNIQKYGKKYLTKIVITDAIHIHSIWYVKGDYIDYYYLIDTTTEKEFYKKFSPEIKNTIVSFFPIEKQYFHSKKKLQSKNIVFILSGIKRSFARDVLKNFSDSNDDVCLTVLQGRKEELFEELQEEFPENKKIQYRKFLPLKEKLPEIDIFIGKPGGAIVSECIAAEVPFIVPGYIPGQEEGNLKLITLGEIGIYEPDGKKISFLIRYLDWNKMKKNFNILKNENSCNIILK